MKSDPLVTSFSLDLWQTESSCGIEKKDEFELSSSIPELSSRSMANAPKETDSQSFNDIIPTNKFLDFSDPFNPFRIENGDNPAAALVSELLTTDNYVSWSRAISRALRAKNKIGFVNGTLPKPTDVSDLLFEAWERCNDLVVSWLQNSVSPSVKSSLVLVDDARVLWLELRDRFTHQNGPRIFQLKRDLASLSQNQDNISTYFGHLKILWDELAIYDPLPDCSCGKLKVMHDRYDRDCVIQFLMGLSDAYSNSRDQIMLLDPLPPLNRVFSMIQQQERQHLMIPVVKTPDLMAMMAKPSFTYGKIPSKFTSQKTNRPYCSYCKLPGHSLENCFKLGNADPPSCTHCNMSGHVADKCYKLHGYPPGHKLHSRNTSKSIAATVTQYQEHTDNDHAEDSSESMMLTRNQYQQLLSLLHSKETSSAMASSSTPTPNTPVSDSRVSGYPFGVKAYKLLDLQTDQIFLSRDVHFHESVFPFHPHFSTSFSPSPSIHAPPAPPLVTPSPILTTSQLPFPSPPPSPPPLPLPSPSSPTIPPTPLPSSSLDSPSRRTVHKV
ncbi:hypothetical protein DKX38_008391 [Salix brachista]|uniref:Retrotransposon Copia-like N-terminal domain-containing protein n=1 Tax=Salix brachista TaxID=2182728 RepID=A0A5N5MR70_9ROSI|nr:hypothetical protein DKX38_008391 [Salix brachista]